MAFVIRSIDELIIEVQRLGCKAANERNEAGPRTTRGKHAAGQAYGIENALELIGAYRDHLRSAEAQAFPGDATEFHLVVVYNVPLPVGCEPEPTEYLFFSRKKAEEAFDVLTREPHRSAILSVRLYTRTLEKAS